MASVERIVVGIDVGTTKIAALVCEVKEEGAIRILGLGIEPATGMHRGTVVDVAQATQAVRSAKQQAERTSGFEIGRAFVSVAGKHIGSIYSRGVTGLNPNRGVVSAEDVARALQAAQAVALPHNREVLHVIPRTFTVDGQPGIRNPIGLHAYRLEVEAHIITAASSALRNLETCVQDAGMHVDRFVLNPLASAEVTLADADRESGVVVIDIGGGTTDIAVFIDGTVWHTAVIEVGGSHVTNDIAMVLHLPPDEAERIKISDGNAAPHTVNPDAIAAVQPFGENMPTQVLSSDLSAIIEARIEEMFTLVLQDLKRSGYDGLLPAGGVLTGGASSLTNIQQTAARVMKIPVRLAAPQNLTGLSDKLSSPSFATSVGLLKYASRTDASGGPYPADGSPRRPRGPDIGRAISDFLGRLLPD
ncbi:MAG: cell division protein FtsA [Anaerolineae bacterium]